MNIRSKILRFGLVVLAGSVLILPPAVMSQDTTTKRKVSHKVVPDFPELARQLNITGKVKLALVVAPDGHVKSTQVLGGSPLLAQSASKAAKDWKFEAGPKETTEIVEFDFTQQNQQ